MKTFNYINQDYIPPVDLQILGTTFSTLEKGHQEAVKTASELKTAMAKLDLNEAEDEYKQNKINEIQSTIKANTTYGNMYSALDDIVAKAGDLSRDPGILGRLQAQKDYKAYRDKIENDKTLPQDYKDYYLENNPYYYEDKYDKNGNIIGGSKWTPKNSPTNIVPLSDMIVKGISIAAKESGGGTITRWIDKNDNITTNPSEAFDGEVYDTITNSWQRLSREKIWQGINAMIASTPGAMESLNQDYNVARWKHEKNVQLNNGKPFESDITDNNGIYLSRKDYLLKRIDPAVQAASYYNSTSNTTYGNGLATYMSARIKAAAADEIEGLEMSKATMSGRNTPVEIKVDVGSEFLATKNIAENNIRTLYKNLTGRNLYIESDIIIKDLDSMLDKYDVPIADRQQIRANVRAYNEAQENLNAYTKDMSEKDKANFLFAARMKSGGQFISSANGGSEYDDELINYSNSLLGEKGEFVAITMSNKTTQNVDDIINNGSYNGYDKLNIKREDNKIIIPKSAIYSLPMVSSIVEKAESRSNKGFLPTLYQILTKGTGRFSVDILDADGNSIYKNMNTRTRINVPTNEEIHKDFNRDIIRKMASVYNKGVEETDKLFKKYKVAPTTITVSSLNLDGKHFTDGTLLDQYNKGFITKEQYNTYKEHFDTSFDNITKELDFSQMQMYYADEVGTRKLVEDSSERFDYGSEILQAIADKRATFSPTIVPGSYDPISGAPVAGYNITVLPKVDTKGNIIGDGKQMRFYIPKMINETASKYMMQDPYVQAFNTISVIGGTKSTRNLTDINSNPRLGKISVTGLGNDTYLVKYGNIEYHVGQKEATKLTVAVNDYNACKNAFISSGESELNSRIKSTLVDSANTISEIFNIKAEHVLDKFIDDINK